MIMLRGIVALLGLGLLVAIVWASLNSQSYPEGLDGNLFEQGSVILALPWGLVTMVDLYVGFAFFAVIVYLTEKRWWVAAAWSLPLLFLGNVWAAVWLVLRLPVLHERLTRPDWPTS